MTKRVFVVLSLFLLLAGAADAADRHIVLFKGGGAPADFAAQVAALGGRIDFQHEVLGVVSGLPDAMAAALRGVAEVQPDVEFTFAVDTGEAESFEMPASPANPAGASVYSRQWHHWAIGADKAWAAGILGSPEVTVAVLDTGIDRRSSPHVDMAGLVDYDRGAQFAVDSPDCIPTGFTFDPTDDLMFHGTHVASTISSNAWAAAGVTSRVRLVPVKVLALRRDLRYDPPAPAPQCSGGSGSLAGVLAGILYAADIDADVANMSLGGGWYKMGNGYFVGLINSTINYAHRKGMVVVVSAGNEAIDLDHDGPLFKTYCSSPNTICVSATGPSVATTANVFANLDSFAGYSNFGRSAINVAAPGGTGHSSLRPRGFVTAACSRSAVSRGLTICRTGNYIVGSNGTSMASPHVSGLAALLVERVGKNRPSLVKAIIEQSADDLWQPGTDPYYGKGRINVARALGLE